VCVVNDDVYQELAGLKRECKFLKNLILDIMLNSVSEAERIRIIFKTVEKASKRIIGPEQDIWINTLDGLSDHLDEAFNYYRKISSPRELELAIFLSHYWGIQGHWTKG